MHTLTVKLKQHTPLLHFQHSQDGATLRASEVKPKLDKFILNKLSEEEKKKGLTEKWIITKNQKIWLDYKMRIESDCDNNSVLLSVKEDDTKCKTEDFPFILANMGGKESEDNLVNFSMYKTNNLFLLTKYRDLADILLDNIDCFFALNNFGQRKTKGFGSFSVIEKQFDNEKEIVISWKDYYKNYYCNGTSILQFQLNFQEDSIDGQRTLFSVIDFYWKCLKSGINFTKRHIPKDGVGNVMIKYPERYIKSYLWTYLNNKNFTWEKRKVKTSFNLETSYPTRNYKDNSNEVIFARALLGCPDKFEFRIPKNEFYKTKQSKYKEKVDTFTVEISNCSGEIERISSPIIFKPIIIDGIVNIFILFDEELIQILNGLPQEYKMYSFSLNGKTIELPLKTDIIDYNDFVKKFHAYVFSNNDFVRSTVGEIDGKVWRSKVKIIKEEKGKVKSRMWGKTDISWKMIPRSFSWENLLNDHSANTKVNDNFVHIKQIVK